MSRDPSDAPDPDEPFLSRWSRRKLRPDEAAGTTGAGNAAPAPAQNPERQRGAQETSAKDLPALDSLDGLKSDYQAFMRPGVGDATRRTALKKLFSDPHFNVMDGLDTYIDDYSIEDPIPDAMLRGLNQARSMMLFDEEKKPEEGSGEVEREEQQAAAAISENTADSQVHATEVPQAATPPEPAQAGDAPRAGKNSK